MSELKEIFEMTTKEIEPNVGSWSEQEHRQRKANRNRRIGAFAMVAALGLVAVAVVLGTRADPNRARPEPGATTDATSEKEVAATFLRSFGDLDSDSLITYLATDSDISGLVGSLGGGGTEGTTDGLRLFISWLEAARYEQVVPDSCTETSGTASGTVVRCPFQFHLLGSREIGRDAYDGSHLDLTVQNGEIVRAAMSWNTDEFSTQMWEPFADWVSTAHPDDAAVMYDDATYSSIRLTPESITLWGRRTREYVEGILPSGPPYHPIGRVSRAVAGVSFSFTVPARGWELFGAVSMNKSIVGPQGAEAMVFWTSFPDGNDARPDDADPCGRVLSSSIGPTAADLAAAVSTAPGTELIAGPSDVSVGGMPATFVAVTVREDVGCDPGYFFTWQDFRWGSLWPTTGVGDTIRVWIVEVGGTRLIIEGETNGDETDGLYREVEQIVRSIRFD